MKLQSCTKTWKISTKNKCSSGENWKFKTFKRLKNKFEATTQGNTFITIFSKSSWVWIFVKVALRENSPNTQLFLVRIFRYFDWIRRYTPLTPCSGQIRENTDQKKNAVFGQFSRSVSSKPYKPSRLLRPWLLT